MNKGIGIAIGVIVIVGIILVSSSLLSEDSQNKSTEIKEIIQEPEPSGKSISLELKEEIGITATP